jgi:hypothetical protein
LEPLLGTRRLYDEGDISLAQAELTGDATAVPTLGGETQHGSADPHEVTTIRRGRRRD